MAGQPPARRPRCIHCGGTSRPLVVIGTVDGTPVWACVPTCPPKTESR